MLVIAPDVSDNTIVRYLKPLQKEKLPDGITFNIVAGKKMYDIIGLHHSWIVFFFSEDYRYSISIYRYVG